MAQLAEETCIHARQRSALRKRWDDVPLPPDFGGVTSIAEIEVDILGGDGQLWTALHSGLILRERKLAVAIYKDISGFKRDSRVLREYAFQDPLTGVTNRRRLQERGARGNGRRPSPAPRRLVVRTHRTRRLDHPHQRQCGRLHLPRSGCRQARVAAARGPRHVPRQSVRKARVGLVAPRAGRPAPEPVAPPPRHPRIVHGGPAAWVRPRPVIEQDKQRC